MPNPYRIGLRPVKQPCRKDTGALGPARRSDPEPRRDRSSTFLPVRVVASRPAAGGAPMACRLVHPSGWVFECGGLPPASWMAAVLAGGNHAAT
jgi:hypothetical protein